ncbi:T-cell surface glycoprotein CD8 alpha chain isoform 1-T1 [Glossophaga mutica]
MWPGVQVLVRPWAPHLNSLSLRLLVNKMRTSTQTLKGARQRGLSPGRRLLAGNGLLRSSRRRRGALRGAGIERAAAPATKGEAHHDARTAATHTSPPQRVAAGVPAPGDVPAGGRQRSGNEGETLRLCYLHMGTTGWHLRGPSSVPGHHRHLQLQKPKTRLQMSQAPGQTGRQAQPFREIRLTWRWALCNSHYKTSNGELSSQGGQQRSFPFGFFSLPSLCIPSHYYYFRWVGGGRVTLSLSLIDTKQNHMSTVHHWAHVSGERAGCVLPARPLELVGASQPPGPNLVPGHRTEEEAEVQGSWIRVTAGLGLLLRTIQISLLEASVSAWGSLCLKPRGNQSFLEHLR